LTLPTVNVNVQHGQLLLHTPVICWQHNGAIYTVFHKIAIPLFFAITFPNMDGLQRKLYRSVC